MEIPRIPLNFNPQAERSVEDYDNGAPITTSAESTSAAFDLAFQDTASMLIGRKSVVNEMEDSGVTKITPEEANKRFPNMPEPFREPVNPYIAQMKADQMEERARLQAKIANGPDDLWTKSKVVGTGILAHAMDPVEFGAGSLLGWGVGGLAARGALGARVATAAKAVAEGTAGFGTRLGVNAIEGVGGNAIQNVGQEALQSHVQSAEGIADYRSSGDIVQDLVYNTFAAAVVHGAISEGSYHLNGLKRELRATSPEADLAIARENIAAIKNDVRPDFNPMREALATETSVKPQEFGKQAYEFQKGSIDGKTLYIATADKVGSHLDGHRVPLGDDFGFGTHLSDNPGVANAAAARSMADAPGAVHGVEVSGLKPLDLDVALPEGKLREDLGGILKGAGVDAKVVDNAISESPAKEVLKYLRNAEDAGLLKEGEFAKVEAAIKAEGYNAMISDGTSHMGFDHDPHNHVTVLDDSLIKQTKAFEPDQSVVQAPNKELVDRTVTRSQDLRNQLFADPEVPTKNMERVEAVRAEANMDSAKIRQETTDLMAEMNERAKMGLLEESDLKQLDAIREGLKNLEDEHTLLKAFASCVRG